jgi:hypothetical protein
MIKYGLRGKEKGERRKVKSENNACLQQALLFKI